VNANIANILHITNKKGRFVAVVVSQATVGSLYTYRSRPQV